MPIYLDNNATTRPAPEVVSAMQEALSTHWANPSSVHRAGQAVRQQVELARESVAQLIGCRDREIVFLSGGTESTNLAIRGALGMSEKRNILITSRLEHSAVRELAESLEQRGTEVVWLPNDPHGIIDLDALAEVLRNRADRVAIVSIMWTNNETGVIEPVEAIGRMCREAGVLFHTDAVQWVGKMPTDLASMPIDLLSFAAHKFHGPKGVGGLYVRRGVRLDSQTIGGPHERSRRAGTENVSGIIGMGVAAGLCRDWLATDERVRLAALRDRFEQSIVEAVGDATIGSAGAPRIWNTSNIAFPRLEAEAILILLSERGVYASAGAACSSGSLDPSPVLLALGIPRDHAHGAIRFSIGRETTDEEIDQAIEVVCASIARLRRSMTAV